MNLDERTVDPAAGLHVSMDTDGRTVTVTLTHAGAATASLTTDCGKDALAAFNHPFAVIPDAAWPGTTAEDTEDSPAYAGEDGA